MAVVSDGPIPGESLTREPGNSPWEQPPQISDPKQVLAFYLDKLDDEEKIDDLLFLLEQKMPLNVIVKSLTTMGVMNGVHTIDSSLLVSPVLHEYLLSLGQAAGIDVVETDGPTKQEKMDKKKKDRFMVMLRSEMNQGKGGGPLEEAVRNKQVEDITSPPTPEEVAQKPSMGLVPRR